MNFNRPASPDDTGAPSQEVLSAIAELSFLTSELSGIMTWESEFQGARGPERRVYGGLQFPEDLGGDDAGVVHKIDPSTLQAFQEKLRRITVITQRIMELAPITQTPEYEKAANEENAKRHEASIQP